MTARSLVLLAALGLLMAACDTATDAELETTTSVPTSELPTTTKLPSIWDGTRPATDIVLELTWRGGFRPAADYVTQIPYLAVYADGSALAGVEAGDRKLQPLVRVQLSGEQLTELDALVHQMNLTRIDEVMIDSKPGLFDFSTTVATYTDPAGQKHTFGVYAVMQGSDEYSPQEQALGLLLSRYGQLGAADQGEPYVPDRVQLYLSLGGSGDFIEWPLIVEPDHFTFGPNDTRCLVVTDEVVAATVEVLAAIDQGVVFERQGRRYQVLARVMLPHEEDGCGPEIGASR